MFPLNFIFALQNAANSPVVAMSHAAPNPNFRPYTNQRKIRVNRRWAFAAGVKRAFA